MVMGRMISKLIPGTVPGRYSQPREAGVWGWGRQREGGMRADWEGKMDLWAA